MATAHKIHRLQNTVDITISPSGTISNAQGYLAVADDTEIEWDNTGAQQFTIVFTIGMDNASITIPGHTTTAPISSSETAVNYVVKNAAGVQVGGPYCIQWGDGVLGISVTSNSPDFTIAIPPDVGNIQFTSDAKYGIGWSANGVWSTQPSDVYPTPPGNPIQTARPGATTPVTCTFEAAANVPGKGTVHIGG
jgi:hypothetical protein